MKFLVDAQLPRRIAAWLNDAGCDAIHTLDLPDGNRATDEQVIEFADHELRVVVERSCVRNPELIASRIVSITVVRKD